MQRVGIGLLVGLGIAGAILYPLAAAAALHVGPRTRQPVVIHVDEGFHWLDAVIGALAALGLVLLVLGFVLTVQRGLSSIAKGGQ
jgi:hypothetical protein